MTEPTAVYRLFNGRIEVALFGRPHNWSLIDCTEETLSRIGDVASGGGIRVLLAPRTITFNAKICEPDELTMPIALGADRQIRRGTDADGVIIPEGQAFYVASADCITIISMDTVSGMTIAAHGGRDCLIDRQRVIDDKPPREYESVVDAIMAKYKQAGVDPKNIKVFLTCGISPKEFGHDFYHEKYGKTNMRLCIDLISKLGRQVIDGDIMRGRISLSEVVRAQFMQLGVPSYQIGFDVVDTYDDKDIAGYHLWWSHRRGDGPNRNAVIVKRVY